MSETKGYSDRGHVLRLATTIGNELLGHAQFGVSAGELAAICGVTRRTVLRYLAEMHSAGWADPTTLDPAPGRRWRPGPVLVSWSVGRVAS